MNRRSHARSVGFTLLEVMVALAILGLGLTSILAAQAGVFASAASARNLSEATGLARCKMSELEEHLLREGFQELDETDSGPCCEGEDSAMSCSWKIEKLELPEPAYGQLDLDTGLDNMGFEPLGAGGGAAGIGAGVAVGGAGPGGIASMLGPITQMIFPVMQGIFETGTRRITVTVTWREGYRDQSLEVMQWVVNSSGLDTGAGAGVGGGGSTSSTGN